MTCRRFALTATMTVLAALGLLSAAAAQPYPSKPITLIVPYPPGGSTDVAARMLAEHMRPVLGQPVIIENVGGAGGSIGLGRLARSAPDGYTIDIGQWDTHVGSIIYKIPYDLQTDFTPIGLMTVNPQLIVARKGLPASDLKGLVAWMKANPGKLTFVNQYAAAQLSGILLEQLTKEKVNFIPYRGAGPAMTDLVAGQVDVLVAMGGVALPQVRAGTIKVLANLAKERSPTLPDMPSADESGLPGLYMPGWFGLFAPKGTPADIIAKLNAAMAQALAQPAVKARFTELGLDIVPAARQTPAVLDAFHKAEIDKWWPIIKAAGLKAE